MHPLSGNVKFDVSADALSIAMSELFGCDGRGDSSHDDNRSLKVRLVEEVGSDEYQ
jgi:flagellar motor switch protein FliM